MKLVHHVILLSALVIFIIVGGCSDNRKIDYQLQEQCGKSCKEYYKEQRLDGWHECHYNKKLNKCFFYYNHLAWGSELFDLHEHKCLGRCMGDDGCSFYGLKKYDLKRDEWAKLIKPYMEE